MTTFYKITDIDSSHELYINPKIIDYYFYTDKGVQIQTNNIPIHASRHDFERMFILEGIDVFWHTQQLTEYLSTQKIRLFYSQNL